MNYLIGDLQGCCDALERLLTLIDFSPSRDRIYILGDLVNRGPSSKEVLQKLSNLGDAAVCLLGNHDLHLLAVSQGVRATGGRDTLDDILNDPRREQWLNWLRQQKMACLDHGWLMVHAGVLPQWSTQQTLDLAAEIESHLQSPCMGEFFQTMYGNLPAQWRDDLQGPERWRVIVNGLTRLRFCTADGVMEFKHQNRKAPEAYMPWFEVPERRTKGQPIAFGHWSTQGLINKPDLLSLDTGCVWGGKLTAVSVNHPDRKAYQVQCDAAQDHD